MRKSDWAVVSVLLVLIAIPSFMLGFMEQSEKQAQEARERSYCALPYASENLCAYYKEKWNEAKRSIR